MSAPTPLTETYVPCEGSTFTLGTDPSTVVLKVIEGGYTRSYSVDEMTNSGSGGAYEDVKCIKSVKGNFTVAVVSGAMPIMNEGDIFAATIVNTAAGTGGSLAGNFRFNDIENNILNVKEGLKVKFSIMGQGAYTVT